MIGIIQGEKPESLGSAYPLLTKLYDSLCTTDGSPFLKRLKLDIKEDWNKRIDLQDECKDHLLLATILAPSLKDLRGLSEADKMRAKDNLEARVRTRRVLKETHL